MTDRRAALEPDEASAPDEIFGVLALIEEEWLTIEILVGTRGSMILRADRDKLPLPRETAAVLIDALVATRQWGSLELGVTKPIDIDDRVESLPLDDVPADRAMEMGLFEDDAFGVLTTEKGSDAVIWLVLRNQETALDRDLLESLIANLTSAWLWLWGEQAEQA